MRKSLLASMLGAIAISITALTAPAFADATSVAPPRAQISPVAISTPTTMTLPAGFRVPVSSAPIALQNAPTHGQADFKLANKLTQNGKQLREFNRSTAKDWNHHQLRQRHAHTMQG